MAKVELKQPIVDEISAYVEKAQSAVLVDYRGLTVEQDTILRKKMREAGVVYKVYKNTMLKRAFEGTAYEELSQHLDGPTAVAFGGTSLRTTELLPILALSPIFIGPRTFAPAPIRTPFPTVGCLFPLSFPVPPNVTP